MSKAKTLLPSTNVLVHSSTPTDTQVILDLILIAQQCLIEQVAVLQQRNKNADCLATFVALIARCADLRDALNSKQLVIERRE